ncbi:CBF1-interacting co-repressor CIR, N-terminal domain [Phytophthora cactorum]|nr:CBF1-interacting co-repressor CIR, N-terminal domain [Phytophthora cactorum]
MSLQFLGQKSWHPASKANQKRIWVAEQQAKEREERERQKAKEVRKAAEALQAQEAAAAAGDVAAARCVASAQVNFLYAAPPGLPEAKEAADKKHQKEEDEAVREFRRRAERRGDSQRSKLERYVGRRAEETLTIKDQVERFPILKDAPVEGKYTETIKVNFNPLGLRLRNVRCIRCGEWGHQSGDRECKLRDQNPNGEWRWEDPVTEINKLKSAKQDLVLRRGALPLEMQEAAVEEFEILQSDDEDVEAAFLATLSTKEKKKLMKKLKKQSRDDSSSGNSVASDSADKPHELYNLLAPPDYVLCVVGPVAMVFLISPHSPFLLPTPSNASIDFALDRPYLIIVGLVAVFVILLLLMELLIFLLFGNLRLHLAPLTLVLLWSGALCSYLRLEREAEQPMTNDKLDIRYFFHGEYFSFEAYARLLGLLLSLAAAAYVQSRDPVVVWTWFIVGLVNRKNTYEDETKESFERLQTAATIAVYIFGVVLFVDTVNGLHDILGKFVPRQDSTPENNERFNTAYGSV